MKFIPLILVLCILVGCSAQNRILSLALLASEEGCSPQQVLRIISCGCFITLFEAPTNREVREQCRSTTGTAVSNSQSACDSFLIENNTNFDFPAIIRSLNDVKNRCFAGAILPSSLSSAANDPAPTKLEQLFALNNQLCELFAQPSSSDVPNLSRFRNLNPATKPALIKKFYKI